MKRSFAILVVAFIVSLSCFAQMEQSKVKSFNDPWKFGVNVSATYDYINPSANNSAKVGMKAGIQGEKHLVYMIYFRPSMDLYKRGYTANYPGTVKADVDGYFLEFDATIELKFGDERLGRGWFLSLTPFFTYGLFGNTDQTSLNPDEESYNKPITYKTFDDRSLTREDIGYKLGLGYDFNHNWEFNLEYLFGFVNVMNFSNYRWRGVSAGLSYFF
ncbi:MAG: outer membrane beta-barrel protein [Bacteroidales bacterium]|nr:outer membrane beta-barrel protein [Bacteroidales bacterium]MBQ9311604.1 outer membrane beta-barrel protein [Bacteroidales bacterium]